MGAPAHSTQASTNAFNLRPRPRRANPRTEPPAPNIMMGLSPPSEPLMKLGMKLALKLRILLFVILFAAPSRAQSPDAPDAPGAVAYTLELAPGPALRITLRVKGEADGSSHFAMAPDWGGIENCQRFVHDLTVSDAAGNPLPAAATEHGWDVTHSPGAPLVARYELRPAERDPLAQFRTHYEPVIRDGLFHVIGETGFIYPEWLENAGPIDVTLKWEGFDAAGWKTVSSFDTPSARIPLQQFRHGIFIAGKVRIHDRDIRGGRLRVAIIGDDWAFEDPEFVDLVQKIVTVEREFMNDFADPYFLVTLVPTGPRASPQSVSMGGTGLTNCFALFLAPGSAVGPGTPHRDHVLRLLAHEYFHNWNGGAIHMEDPEQLVYWFSEGFTDFYASRLLRTAGLIDGPAWTRRLNETIQNLWLSPVAREPAETIRREFWTRPDVQQLPYLRGEVVALVIDEEIRRVSGGEKSLDDFIREVLADARKGEKVQTESLVARIAKWTSPEFAQSIRRIVVDGEMPDPPRRLSDPVVVRVDSATYRYDSGFDVDASLASRVISGVRAGSPAHAAGLRDGQKVEGASIHRGNPDKEITLKVSENGERKEIRYWPRGAPVTIPVYQPASAPNEGGPNDGKTNDARLNGGGAAPGR